MLYAVVHSHVDDYGPEDFRTSNPHPTLIHYLPSPVHHNLIRLLIKRHGSPSEAENLINKWLCTPADQQGRGIPLNNELEKLPGGKPLLGEVHLLWASTEENLHELVNKSLCQGCLDCGGCMPARVTLTFEHTSKHYDVNDYNADWAVGTAIMAAEDAGDLEQHGPVVEASVEWLLDCQA